MDKYTPEVNGKDTITPYMYVNNVGLYPLKANGKDTITPYMDVINVG